MKKSFLLSFYLLCISQLTACTSSLLDAPSSATTSNNEEYGLIDATDRTLGNCGVNGISCSETALVNYTKTEANYRAHTERTPRDHLYTKAGVGNNLTATVRPSIENDIITSNEETQVFETTSIKTAEVKEEYIPVVDDGDFTKTGALVLEADKEVPSIDTNKKETDVKVATTNDTPIKVADSSILSDNSVAIADNINVSKKIITKTITEEDGTIYELVCQDADCKKVEQIKQTIQGEEGKFEIVCEEDCEDFMLANIDENIITSEFTEESFDLPSELEEDSSDTEIEFKIVGTDEEVKEQVFADITIEETKVTDDTILTWEANEGENVRELLTKWSNLAGWKLLWNTNRNYTLSAGVVFKGKFADVSSALIRAFARARPAPIATYYKGNRVIVVETMENENAY